MNRRGARAGRLVLALAGGAALAGCPRPATAPQIVTHTVDSDDPVDPHELCPPEADTATSNDGCPDPDAGGRPYGH